MTGVPTVHTHSPDKDSDMLLRSLFILFGATFGSCACCKLLDAYTGKIAAASKQQHDMLNMIADLQQQRLAEQSSPAICAINEQYRQAGEQERKSVDPADWLTTKSRVKAVKLLMQLPAPDSHTLLTANLGMSPLLTSCTILDCSQRSQ